MKIDKLMYELKSIKLSIRKLQATVDSLLEPRTIDINPSNFQLRILALPDNLRKSYLALLNLREGTAFQVSEETGRVRAVESANLNELVRLGYLRKKRKSKCVIFY